MVNFIFTFLFKSRELKKLCFFHLMLAFVALKAQAQEANGNLIFKEGVFKTAEDFLKNSAISKDRIISSLDKNHLSFFENLLSANEIIYIDSLNIKKTILKENIWGYTKNNAVFINYNGKFYRLNTIGKLCHFIAEVITYTNYISPINNFGGFSTINQPIPIKQLIAFFFDADNKQIKEFNPITLSEVLEKDTTLYEEYSKLSYKKRKKNALNYLRKYNEKNKLFFN